MAPTVAPLDSSRQALVLGAGPVGQTAALLLAEWGIPVVMLDARPERDPIGSKALCQQRDVLDVWDHVGAGKATENRGLLDKVVEDLTAICGQKPVITKAKKSIAGFKLREGNAIGVKVTLRGDNMWEFFDRLVNLAIPRIRDFRGLSPKSFDGRGNYTFGVTEQLIFPEIDYDQVDASRGMDITLVTTARTDAEGKALLDAFSFPFRREGQQ